MNGSSHILRVARRHGAYAFHASTDGSHWHLIRHFAGGDQRDNFAGGDQRGNFAGGDQHGNYALGGKAGLEVGFEVQSPVGEGCAARFTEIAYRPGTLAELRDGT